MSNSIKPDYFTEEEAERIAEENVNLIHEVANKFRTTSHLSYEEIAGAGSYGYAKAIKTFDKNKNIQFSTYAYTCIRNEIITFLKKESKFQGDLSLSREIYDIKDEGSLSFEDFVSNDIIDGMDVELKILLAEDISVLIDAINMLHPRERFLIENRYGVGGRKEKTQQEIGEMLNRTQAGISKMEKQIMKKLFLLLKDKLELEGNAYYNGGRNKPVAYQS